MLNNGAFQDITGSTRVAVNATVCKTGSTTGTTCGRVLQYNTTVNYPQGTVFGLTTTNVCTKPAGRGPAQPVPHRALATTRLLRV